MILQNCSIYEETNLAYLDTEEKSLKPMISPFEKFMQDAILSKSLYTHKITTMIYILHYYDLDPKLSKNTL